MSIEHHISGPQYWRSLEQLAETPEVLARIEAEFPNYSPDEIRGLSRRKFMKLMAASMALAGIGLGGCRRWPRETLAPQTSNVEGRIPGLSEHFATVMELDGVGHGLLVTSYEGRPIKIEGNSLHPMARVAEKYGSAGVFAQASVLELYDPERSRTPVSRTGNETKPQTWDEFRAAAAKMFGGAGAGVAVLTEAASGPTFADLRERFLKKFAGAKWYEYEPISGDAEREGTREAFGQPLRPMMHLDKAAVVFALDADFLGVHPAHTRYANDWVGRRKSADANKTMSRVYVAESRFSITGAVADHRLPMRPSRALAIMTNVAARLGITGTASAVGELSAAESRFVDAVAHDLKAAGKNAVVTAGAHVSPQVQALAMQVNAALGAIGNTLTLFAVPDAARPTHASAIAQLAKDIQSGAVHTLLILGGNPAYDAPAELELEKHIAAVPNSIHLSNYRNETSLACLWHAPRAHYLECWGDARAYDGTVSIQQPLIEPLFGGISSIELLAMLSGDEVRAGRALVQRTFGGSEADFRRALHDGVVPNSGFKPVSANIQAAAAGAAPSSAPATAPAAPAPGNFEVRFFADPSVYDGRFANNGWLQETPDPLSKLTWDNAALISQADAATLDVGNGGMLSITVSGRSMKIPAFILPGQPIGVIGLPLGYGRRAAGNIGNSVGFDTYQIRPAGAGSFATVADVKKIDGSYTLVATQEHHIIDRVGFAGREERIGEKHKSGIVVREATLSEYSSDPRAPHPHGHGNVKLQLFDPPMLTDPAHPHAPIAFNEPHAWGMAVDMTACIGCNACVVACVSENNIPVVGKDNVAVNREMHWIRIDRYFKGAADDPNPEVTFQPMMCVHCENAPCEQVCPVAATVHDTEGLNTMVYNRCIGTRYCSNNCPYKVRRFNYFDWHSIPKHDNRFPMPWPNMPDTQQRESVDPIHALVFNPDVTVRMRGVMEKCTYCTQRIQGVKIKAKNDFLAGKRDSEIVKDGEVLTACQQACPTQAITFGNLNDKTAAVTALHHNPRAYSVLEELNTRPRTQYLAKLRNPSDVVEGAKSNGAAPAAAGAGAAGTKESAH